MELLLLRHGQAAGNAEGRYVGRTDAPLTAEGIEDLKALGRDEDQRLVFVSPLRRARDTATLFFPRAEQRVLPDLREMDFGRFENRSAAEMENDADYRRWVEAGCVGTCPEGDSLEGFVERVQRGFRTAVAEAMEKRLDRLVLVAHGGTFMTVMGSWANDGRGHFEWFAPNGGGFAARLDEETWAAEPRFYDVRPVLGPRG